MNDAISTHTTLEKTKKKNQHGADYWTARALMQVLEYDRWENFEAVLERAKEACAKSGVNVQNHFLETTQMVGIGSGAERKVRDYWLSRHACYLVTMNGDPTKPIIAAAQTYFAIQTRRQEITDQEAGHRLEWREKVKEATKELNSTAKEAGVERYGLFHDHGYRGLYGMSLPEIKQQKGIAADEKLFDRAGLTGLAANAFRATQTTDALKKRKVKGEHAANETHFQVARKVRTTIAEIGGTMPEKLAAEPSIQTLKAIKKQKQISN
ncbi:MAG: DNA damage-inducible protein D [Verrucomicrobiia bacterium]